MEHIVGVMWNKNEADILGDTITSALKNVDSLMIADDGSTDRSWEIISYYAKNEPRIEHIQQKPDKNDPAQRQALLDKVRSRYKASDTWVQIIESDIMILDTDIRQAVAERNDGEKVEWVALNALLNPKFTWAEFDHYPNWQMPIQDYMTHAHYMEKMWYTFRPLSKLYYTSVPWRPWPRGFSPQASIPNIRTDYTPLLAHYGYRGPTHVYQKYQGKKQRRYPSWDMSSKDSILKTVYFFNGRWNSNPFPMSRDGWKGRKG